MGTARNGSSMTGRAVKKRVYSGQCSIARLRYSAKERVSGPLRPQRTTTIPESQTW
jgi:hypothetical protein